MCKGKFLLELADDSALFAGLFMLIGFFAYAWVKTGSMPSRGAGSARGSTDNEGFGGSEGTDEGKLDYWREAGKPVSDDPVQGAREAGAVAKRLEELEAQVKRLVAREGQSKGLLGGEKTGRRARSVKGLFKRGNTKPLAPPLAAEPQAAVE